MNIQQTFPRHEKGKNKVEAGSHRLHIEKLHIMSMMTSICFIPWLKRFNAEEIHYLKSDSIHFALLCEEGFLKYSHPKKNVGNFTLTDEKNLYTLSAACIIGQLLAVSDIINENIV